MTVLPFEKCYLSSLDTYWYVRELHYLNSVAACVLSGWQIESLVICVAISHHWTWFPTK